MRVAAHRRDNYRLVGLERRKKEVSLQDYIAEKYGDGKQDNNDEP